MGSFSVFHWLFSAPIILLLLLVAFGIYFALRKRSGGDRQPPTPQVKEEVVTAPAIPATVRSNFQKIVSITYLVGGGVGALTIIPQINGVSLGILSAFAWLFLLAQIGAAIYGGWQYWKGNVAGLQVLYWLSWSCIPVISFPLLSYWCAMGFGLLPTIAIGAGHFGTDITVRFGYDSTLWLFPSESRFLMGANLVAIWFTIMIDRTMKASGIPRWPLALNFGDPATTDRPA